MRLIPVNLLKENSYVAINIINNEGRLLLKSGQKITSKGIQTLNKLGVSYVYINDEYCFNHEPHKYTTQIDQFYDNIVKLTAIAKRVINGTSDSVDIESATNIAHEIVDDILSLPSDFKISYEPTKLVVNSIIERTIYVAIMSTVLGFRMKLSKDKLVKLCLTALLKDLALFSPKITMSNESYKTHPLVAYTYLKQVYNLDEKILEGILQHHEHFDGSGYPNQLKGKNICTFARIISIVDCFYELKSNHELINNNEQLFESRLKTILRKFDIEMISYFIKNSEVFTLDTLIRLNNDDLGVIIKNGETNPFKPIIKIVKSNTYSVGEIIDLQEHSHLSIKNLEYYVED